MFLIQNFVLKKKPTMYKPGIGNKQNSNLLFPAVNVDLSLNADKKLSTSKDSSGNKKGSTAVPRFISWKNKGTPLRRKLCFLEPKEKYNYPKNFTLFNVYKKSSTLIFWRDCQLVKQIFVHIYLFIYSFFKVDKYVCKIYIYNKVAMPIYVNCLYKYLYQLKVLEIENLK